MLKAFFSIVLCVFLLSACSQSETLAMTTQAVPQIRVSGNTSGVPYTSLDGRTISGKVYVYVPHYNGLSYVSWHLDGKGYGKDRRFPYSFRWDDGLVNTVNNNVWKEGPHTLTVRYFNRNGTRQSYTARFNVRNQAAPAPSPTPTPTPEPTPVTNALWSADHETGNMNQWYLNGGGGEFNSGGGTSSASTAQARSGRYSAALKLSNVTSQQGVRLFRWNESDAHDELYYSAWFYFPQRHTPTRFWNLWQHKSKNSNNTLNDSFWQLNVGNRSDGQMHFYLYNWVNARSHPQTAMNIPVGRWFQVEVYYKIRGDNTGAITVWQDGVQLWSIQNVQTKYSGGRSDWSINNYTDGISPNSVTVYVDDAAISQSRIGR